MNKLIALAALGLCFSSVYAKGPKKDKNDEGFVFTTVKENPITSIKNQNRSSTCWSFSSLGYLESELLRLGKGEFDLSEMFVVHKLRTLSRRCFFLTGRKFLRHRLLL